MPKILSMRRDLSTAQRKQSFSADDNTVEVCWAAGAVAKQYDWRAGQWYLEKLDMNPSSIRLDRMKSGSMSLVDTHETWSMESRLGVVLGDSIRFEGEQAFAKVRLSRHGLGERLLKDLEDGIPFPVSVGYRVYAYEEIDASEDGALPTRTVTDWEPYELTACPVQADPQAHSRSIQIEEGASMPQIDVNSAPANKRPSARRWGVAEQRTLAERYLPADEIDAFVRQNGRLDETSFRDQILDHLAERQEQAPTFPISASRGSANTFDYRVDALFARMTGTAPSEPARQYAHLPLIEHARDLLCEAGVAGARQFSRGEVASRSLSGLHTTSDFPRLLQTAGERVIHQAYQLALSPLRQLIAKPTFLPDFRPKTGVRVGDIGLLKKVNEAGEIEGTTRAEVAGANYKLETFARIFSMSRQAIINDDLGALTNFVQTAGRMAAQTENALLFSLLTQNGGVGPVIAETGVSLFHASHGNLAAAGTALDIDSLSAARRAMREQKDVENGDGDRVFINVRPKYLVVGPALETSAEKVLSQISASKAEDVNPFSGKLELAVEPRIEDSSWYLFADRNETPTVEYAHLEGEPGPQFMADDGFDVLGTSFRVTLDFGAGVIDFRGAYRNPGL